jgi:hypothetical protein
MGHAHCLRLLTAVKVRGSPARERAGAERIRRKKGGRAFSLGKIVLNGKTDPWLKKRCKLRSEICSSTYMSAERVKTLQFPEKFYKISLSDSQCHRRNHKPSFRHAVISGKIEVRGRTCSHIRERRSSQLDLQSFQGRSKFAVGHAVISESIEVRGRTCSHFRERRSSQSDMQSFQRASEFAVGVAVISESIEVRGRTCSHFREHRSPWPKLHSSRRASKFVAEPAASSSKFGVRHRTLQLSVEHRSSRCRPQ